MTTDEILAGIDRSLAAVAAERQQLLTARDQLVGARPETSRGSAPRGARSRSKSKSGQTLKRVLGALDPTEPRTASDVEKIAKVGRALAASTLSRLVKQGLATKADRGYLLASP